MKTALARLLGGTLTAWVALLWPVWQLGGAVAVAQSLAACLLCLVPAALTLVWTTRAAVVRAEQRLAATLGGMLVRMIGVLAGGLALFLEVPALHSAGFWIWVLGFYLFTLALEMALVLANEGGLQTSPKRYGG